MTTSLSFYLLAAFLLSVLPTLPCNGAIISNSSKVPEIPGMEVMASDKYPHFGIVERVSRTKWHRHRRQVIAGPIYEWQTYEIPYFIWGGDYNFQNLIRRGIHMWEEATCLRFRENAQARDAISVLSRVDWQFFFVGSDKVQNKYSESIEEQLISELLSSEVLLFSFSSILLSSHNFQNLIRRGIHMWEEATCLRFRENAQARDAIRYVLERGDSCFTEYIGRNGGYQDIIIGSECAEEYVVAHETGHALGFWHTHQRPDRERYISINWKNVLEEATASFMPFRSMLQAFGIQQISHRRTPYDYGSLMHYHAVAHAVKVSDFTIVPKELKYVTTMGTERMAFLDAKVINDIYCPNACYGRQRLNCHAGGYPDPNNCNVCRCPEGLAGAECTILQPSSCGSELTATDQWQTLTSPSGKNIDCYWRISAPNQSRIRFRLSDGEFACSYGCQSYVEIKHKLDVRLTGFRSCCYRPKEDTVSDSSQVFVIYHPNGRSARFTLRYIREP
ncbi:Zinc metalloproteinase nas-26 [Toxocara canis]|uniref:Zinc metalloproteinase n=1 Tax=Toxocara canis TaxID=6265 RepID=A0A0B2UWT6_TOXCA|nr:Zinc metalloproteinase nas-26 [Toxocara canis]